jgi:diguanylate cyclase (GGDEF)-like protein
MKRHPTLTTRIIAAVALFFLSLLTFISYFHYRSMQQYTKESEMEKCALLLDSIEPVITINMFLGPDEPMHDYLQKIVRQNPMIVKLTVKDMEEGIHFTFSSKTFNPHGSEPIRMEHTVFDKITSMPIGKVEMLYSNARYIQLIGHYREFTILLFIGAAALAALLVIMLHSALAPLRELAGELASYDPQKLDFSKKRVDKNDEVGIIQNAVVDMVEKIQNYTKTLSQLNLRLENKVKERTHTLENTNARLRREVQERIKAEEALKNANRTLERLSVRDTLTNLYNRRGIERSLKTCWRIARREKTPISIIMCDIDFFKKINDTYGHVAGDICLQEIAKILKHTISRPMDIVARYGGEEFIFILPDTHLSGAVTIANEIQKMFAERNNSKKTKIKMTVSIGISSCIPKEKSKRTDLVSAADNALYEAKKRGRDRIVVHPLQLSALAR